MHVPVRHGHGGLGYPIRDAHAKRAALPGPLLLFSLADAGGRLAPVQQVRAGLAQLSKLITIRDCPVIFPHRIPTRRQRSPGAHRRWRQEGEKLLTERWMDRGARIG